MASDTASASASASSSVDLSSVPGLSDFSTYMSEDEQRLAGVLINAGQQHVFAGWKAGEDEEKKHAFFEQVRGLEAGYPGGVAAYTKQAQKLLSDSAAGANPFEGYTPEIPDGVKLEFGTSEFESLEDTGLSLFKDCACVLVAGGLGERLGFSGIKVALPTETTTNTKYLDLYAQQILALQEASNKLTGSSNVVPLAIMTSGDTHDRTADLLAANSNFGLADGQVTLIKQEKVASLIDNDAHFAVSPSDPYTLDTKPHGHGDVHTLLHSSGLAAKWASEGRKYIVFFQDTNALCFTITVAAVGFSAREKLEVNSICVPRKAGEAVGAIARLKHTNGSAFTCNVEYNQLEPLLRATLGTGDENDASGWSPFPGNINQLVFSIPEYAAVLERTSGLVPEFVNPKYADAEKTKFTKPTRLECMMQDHPKVLGPEARVGFAQFPGWTYSPVKNSLEEAQKKAAIGVLPRCASEGELEFYEAHCIRLRLLGCDVAAAEPWMITGFELPRGPSVVLRPNVGPTIGQLRPKFPTPSDVKISLRSTLIVDGSAVFIESLNLDGALEINACEGATVVIKHLNVSNRGYEAVPLAEDADVPEEIKIRGFTVVKHEAVCLNFPAPGSYVIDDREGPVSSTPAAASGAGGSA